MWSKYRFMNQIIRKFMMSLALVYFYIIIGLCFLLFVNYKFIKFFMKSSNQKYTHDMNLNDINDSNKKTKFDNNNINENYSSSHVKSNIWSIPGPLRFPFLGTKWIYLWKYKLSKIHEVYRGNNNWFLRHSQSLIFLLIIEHL